MKVAKLVYYSFATRVVVDENATQDDIIKESKRMMVEKVNSDLGENLESIDEDGECPFGTFETDDPTIDRIILNLKEQQYMVFGRGIPVQVIRFDNFTDWDSVQNADGEPTFDVQIDDDGQYEDGTFVKEGATHPYTFQYVDLNWREDQDNWEIGMDYRSVNVELTEKPITEVLTDMMLTEHKQYPQ